MSFKFKALVSLLPLALLTVFVSCSESVENENALELGDISIQALSSAQGPKVYIVRLKDGVDVDQTLDSFKAANAVGITHRYKHALKGGAILVANEAARRAIADDERVESLEEDQPVYASAPRAVSPPVAQSLPTGYRLIGAGEIANQGSGARVAVLDTGIDIDHSDLAANVDLAYAKDCVNEGATATFDDGNGHGSHVAGTIAALNNSIGSVGIGTQIKVVPVKVLNKRGSGSWSTIICGIDHVTANAGAIQVANMSLGGSGTECQSGIACTKSALQIAVENSVAAGVTYAVAAGNESSNAALSVPSAYDAVITVSAYRDTDGVLSAADGWASFTNFGSDVDIAAPGVNIYSTWKSNGYNTISGTSMACPHVAAAAALYLSRYPGSTPAQVRDGLRGLAKTIYPGSTDPKHLEPLLDIRGL